ncbi:MAG: protein kinase [Tatlockia sp.]|nr:protein kinase [Tatlockia sp.]
MAVEIDLMQEQKTEVLEKIKQFFEDQAKLGIKLWRSGDVYTLNDGTDFQFKYGIFQRKRKDGHDGFCYELLSPKDPLGEGGFGLVHKIKRTLTFTKDGLQIKKHGKDELGRVVKVQMHSDKNPLENLQIEYELTKWADSLAIKEPTLIGDSDNPTSLTVMNRLPGRELFDIIYDDYEGIEVLTLKQRFELSQALLISLENLSFKGIVHRDIKPENIFVDLNKIPIAVTIFDYGFGFFANAPDGKQPGSKEYVAPEIVNPDDVGYKADVYSMARVIAKLWRVDTHTYNGDLNFLWPLTDRIANLFNGILLPFEKQNEIRIALSGMLKTKPQHRYSIAQAVRRFPSFDENDLDNTLLNKSLGRRLSAVLTDDYQNKKLLTTEQRLDLTHALINALNEQVTSKGRILCDLNTSNIFVDLNKPITVSILNSGLGFEAEMGFDEDASDSKFGAPELLDNSKTVGYEADVFSIARIIAMVWRSDLTTYNKPSPKGGYNCWTAQERVAKLFCQIFTGLTIDTEEQIRTVLKGMLQNNPEQRLSIAQASSRFPLNKVSALENKENKRKQDTLLDDSPNSKRPTFFKAATPKQNEVRIGLTIQTSNCSNLYKK